MPRNISFALTRPQIENRTKTVTRRLGWKFIKVGDTLRAVNKVMGFKKGEKPIYLSFIRVVSVYTEPLSSIDWVDVEREGYPGKTPAWFIDHFCKAMKCTPGTIVNRIEFEYLET
jgi:hypothetical protein